MAQSSEKQRTLKGDRFKKMLQGGEKVSHSWKLLPSNWRIWSHPRFVVGDNFYKPVSNLVYLPLQAKCTQFKLLSNFKNQNHQSFFPCLPNSPPTQKKYPRARCFKQINFGETKAFTNDKKTLWRSHSWSESSIAGWKCPPFPNVFPLFKKEDYNCYG